jgi:SAM-dependent methyltransferase
VPDAIFAHSRLAPVYDSFDGPRDDLAAYVGIAGELGADRVLDVGCGTGSLAILLAGTGRTVVGVDPAGASLEVARSKDGSAAVTWIQGDAAAIPAIGADLALMTGNVAQVFLTDEDWAQVLRAIGAALRRFLADGAVVTSDSTLRFRGLDELESSLAAQGYHMLDVREAPDRPGREFVFIAQRAA